MKVEFKTSFAQMTFEMGQPQAFALLRQALEYAVYAKSPEPTPAPQESPVEPVEDPSLCMEPEPTPAPQAGTRGSRTETLFGPRDAWGGPRKAVGHIDREERKYKGFMYIRCESCEQEKGFNTKFLLSHYKCECGHQTKLEDLLPVNVLCKCGKKFRYMTNIEDSEFTMNCLNCEAPIDLILTGRRDGFVTFNSLNH